jgi:mono/diheme cytochrome c family protein
MPAYTDFPQGGAMRIGIPVLAAAAAMLLFVEIGAAGDESRVSEGKVLFGRFCAACHGVDAKGNGPAAGGLEPPPADLTTLGERYGMPLPKASLAAFIDGRRSIRAHGSSDMPVWGTLLTAPLPPSTAGENQASGNIHLILTYLETLQPPKKG